ncbi:2-keto-4-pentenoate hydratase [Mesobacillus campisalis]|uniref:2-keto-4-pentenoate hydratase n=1 Tax=Mesobacillus campisalis TaxID=1408103 RepID=A0A0M2SQD9_9BACI|nr:fumarylacetoacetate hydrolase family protein [Mesobacillus campisalis]KKK36463.1 2-keto-4-pentenoate hydratase [Mesobacillus campisalis]
MTNVILSKAVQLLDDAYEKHQSIPVPLSTKDPSLTVEDAYKIQIQRIEKATSGGDHITGKKIGLTSLAMQNLLCVDQPDYGHLLQSMEVPNGGIVSLSTLFQPKIEGEIAFVLKQDLTGPNVSAESVLAATDYVIPAIEIVDSRIKDWKIKLVDTVADNASCGLYVLGTNKVKLSDVDLKSVHMKLLKNSEAVNEGSSTDVLGDPALCVAWLANKLHEYGVSLKAGEVILSGALSEAVEAKPGDQFTASFSTLGEASVQFSQ